MKTLTLTTAIAIVCVQGMAAQDTTSTARPSVSHPGGVAMIHHEIPGSPIVATRIYLLGGPSVAGSELAGIEPLLLNVAYRGSADYPGRALRAHIASLGGATFVSAYKDWTVYGVDGFAADFERLFDAFADALVAPELAPRSLELERQRTLTLVNAVQDDPASIVSRLAAREAFRDHAYALPESGGTASLGRVTAEALLAYHTNQVVKSRMLVVVVGGVGQADAARIVATKLGSLPQGDYVRTPVAPWTSGESTVTVEQRSLPTNYIRGLFGGPPATHEDYPAFQLAVATLSGLVGSAIRSEGLSYAAGASLIDSEASGGAIFLSTPEPERSLDIINQGIQLMKDVVFRRSTLREHARNSLLSYYIQNETPGQQADFLARSHLRRGTPQSLDDYIQMLYDIDPAAVRRAARDYFQNIRWAYLGDPALVPESKMRWH